MVAGLGLHCLHLSKGTFLARLTESRGSYSRTTASVVSVNVSIRFWLKFPLISQVTLLSLAYAHLGDTYTSSVCQGYMCRMVIKY